MYSIITHLYFYKKTFKIKVVQNLMEITLCFNNFFEKNLLDRALLHQKILEKLTGNLYVLVCQLSVPHRQRPKMNLSSKV